jgi:hypothetical protein
MNEFKLSEPGKSRLISSTGSLLSILIKHKKKKKKSGIHKSHVHMPTKMGHWDTLLGPAFKLLLLQPLGTNQAHQGIQC